VERQRDECDDWDGHIACDRNHQARAAQTDKAVAGLLTDLKSRGLLEDTLVIWGGEFGRSPTSDGGANGAEGRDHNPYGFTIWMAGGGVKGGQVIGGTDELGLRAVQEPVHLNDLHASILGMLGLDHERLTYPLHGPELPADGCRRQDGPGEKAAKDVRRKNEIGRITHARLA
jgi:Uncharacterized protein conserved in bacteria